MIQWLANFSIRSRLLALVGLHVAMVAALSLARRRNLALAMVTGRAEGAGPDLVARNRGWLAAVLLVAFVGFGAWLWQTPAVVAGAGDSATHSRHHGHGHEGGRGDD